MLKKITKWETEDGKVFDTQEEAEEYMFEQEKEVMTHTSTEQYRTCHKPLFTQLKKSASDYRRAFLSLRQHRQSELQKVFCRLP